MTEKKAVSPKEKICPLATAGGGHWHDPPLCLGDKCALFINIQKPRLFSAGETAYSDPETKLVFNGCGLIVNIPWSIAEIKRQKDPSAR